MPRRSTASILLLAACAGAPAPTTAPLPEATGTVAPRRPIAALPEPPAPAGARVTLARTACFGSCPVYEVSLYESGVVVWHGVEFVTLVGDARRAIDPAVVEQILAGAETLLDRGDGAAPSGCTTDMGAAWISVTRGDVTRTLSIDESVAFAIDDSSDTMTPEASLAASIDATALTWLDDPQCRGLVGTRLDELAVDPEALATALELGVDVGANPREDWMLARLRRDPTLALRLRCFDTDGALAIARAHRTRLIERGAPPDRVVIEAMLYPTQTHRAGVVLEIGPAHCFAAAR